MKKLTLTAVALLACASAFAKLPTPVLDDAAKAKAAEAAARTAWQAKVDAYKLCQAQDRVAAQYKRTHGGAAVAVPAKDAKPVVANGTAKAEGGGTPTATTTAALPPGRSSRMMSARKRSAVSRVWNCFGKFASIPSSSRPPNGGLERTMSTRSDAP